MKKQALTIAGVAVCVILVVGALVGVLSMQPAETTTTTTAQPSQPSNPPAGGAMTKAQWEAVLDKSNFDNYTLSQLQNTNSDVLVRKDLSVFKVTSGKVEIDTYWDDELQRKDVFTGADADEQKKVAMDVFLPILVDFDNFVYNNDKDCYTNVNPISNEVTTEQSGLEVKIVMVLEHLTVKVKDGKLSYAEYDGTYTTIVVAYNMTVNATIDGTWEFTNYGTTVID